MRTLYPIFAAFTVFLSMTSLSFQAVALNPVHQQNIPLRTLSKPSKIITLQIKLFPSNGMGAPIKRDISLDLNNLPPYDQVMATVAKAFGKTGSSFTLQYDTRPSCGYGIQIYHVLTSENYKNVLKQYQHFILIPGSL